MTRRVVLDMNYLCGHDGNMFYIIVGKNGEKEGSEMNVDWANVKKQELTQFLVSSLK